jgi:hypothetical protein
MLRADGKIVAVGADLEEEDQEEGATSAERTKDSALTASNSTIDEAEGRSAELQSRESGNQSTDPATTVVEAPEIELPPLNADLAPLVQSGMLVLDGETAKLYSQHNILALGEFNRESGLRLGQPRVAFFEEQTALVVVMMISRRAIEGEAARVLGGASGIQLPSIARGFTPTEAAIVNQAAPYVFD